MLSPSSSAAMAMMPTVTRLAFSMSAATKSTQTSASQPCFGVEGEVKAVFYCQPRRLTLSADRFAIAAGIVIGLFLIDLVRYRVSKVDR